MYLQRRVTSMPCAMLDDAGGTASYTGGLLVLAPSAYTLFGAFQILETAGAYL